MSMAVRCLRVFSFVAMPAHVCDNLFEQIPTSHCERAIGFDTNVAPALGFQADGSPWCFIYGNKTHKYIWIRNINVLKPRALFRMKSFLLSSEPVAFWADQIYIVGILVCLGKKAQNTSPYNQYIGVTNANNKRRKREKKKESKRRRRENNHRTWLQQSHRERLVFSFLLQERERPVDKKWY